MTSLKGPPAEFWQKWKPLEETVKSILRLDTIPRVVWHARFSDICSICCDFPEFHSDQIYFLTKLLLETHVSQLLQLIQSGGTENQLQNYCTYWQNYIKGIKFLETLYQYFNDRKHKQYAELSFHMSNSTEFRLMEIGECLGLDIWKRIIIIPLKNTMPKLLLDDFNKQRYNLPITTPLDTIAVILKSFVEVQKFEKNLPLELYQSYFEQSFLKRTSEYFQLESTKLLEECTVTEFIVRVLKIMNGERHRSKTYLHESTYDKLQSRFCKIVISDNLDFLHEESEAMLKEERHNDMHNMYLLLREIKDGFGPLPDTFREIIKRQGIKVLESLGKNQACIE